MSKEWKKPRIARCIEATGSLPAGVLLYRILWWDTRDKVLKNGQFWIVNSIERWMFDTGLSRQQLRDAFDTLRRMGITVTEKHLFQSKIHSFVRVAESGLQTLMESGRETAIESGPEALMESGPETAFYKKGVLEESSGMEIGELTLAGLAPMPGDVSEGDDEMKPVKSVMDVEAAVKARKILHKPNTPKALGMTWAKRVNEITGAYVAIQPKDLGQFKTFVAKCPPGKAEAVLEHVLDDWIMFAKKCETMAGVKNTPTVPNLDFLLKYANVAVILATPKKAPPMKHEATIGLSSASKMQLVSPSPPNPKPEVKKPQSLAEIWADPDEEDEE